MLGAHPIHPVLLATDLTAARDVYHTKLAWRSSARARPPSCFGAAAGRSWT
jgi:hypothetical protein